MNDTPDVSFVITGLNAAATVCAAVGSALAQEGVRHEVVYVDDGSDDGSADLVERIGDHRLRVVRSPHIGRSNALNLGVSEVRADLVAILDADDLAAPHRSLLQLEYLRAHPGCQVIGGQAAVVGPSGRIDTSGRLEFPTRPEVIDAWLRRGRMPLSHPSSTFRRKWFASTGGYDPAVPRAEDFDLMLRGWRPGAYAALPDVITTYRTALFPTWAYWRRELIYTRAVHRRWLREEIRLGTLDLAQRRSDVAVDAFMWSGQLVRHLAWRGLRPARG